MEMVTKLCRDTSRQASVVCQSQSLYSSSSGNDRQSQKAGLFARHVCREIPSGFPASNYSSCDNSEQPRC